MEDVIKPVLAVVKKGGGSRRKTEEGAGEGR
jgi:hypothetical protein